MRSNRPLFALLVLVGLLLLAIPAPALAEGPTASPEPQPGLARAGAGVASATSVLGLETQPAGVATTPPAGRLAQEVTYVWVNNQGPNPPITYQWVEISNTGMKVAQGGVGTYEEVALGFPFSFYGITYTTLFVSSSGFATFGTGDGSAYNGSIPSSETPNNAIYAFWADLMPLGGGFGDIYAQQVAADRYVVQWNRVPRVSGSGQETFEIILNGADNTISLQYQSVAGTDSCTVGVENADGTGAVQYAYNAAGVIMDRLAIRFLVPRTLYLPLVRKG